MIKPYDLGWVGQQQSMCVSDCGKAALGCMHLTVQQLCIMCLHIICRSLDFTQVVQCPQTPWMGACRYRQDDTAGSGSVLGYINGDILEQEEGVLMLMYTGGDCGNGKTGVVHVHFQCGKSVVSREFIMKAAKLLMPWCTV